MSFVLALANHKGGVGKTTSTLNLAAALHELGLKVLAVDLDPQGGLTIASGYDPERVDPTVYDAMRRPERELDVRVKASYGADLLPANVDLALLELELVSAVARERRLAAALAPLREEYDAILIDCQPSLGLLTLNALATADGVMIPVACEYLALRAVRGMLGYIRKVQGQVNSGLAVIGLLPTMFDRRTKHAADTLAGLREHFEPRIKVLDQVVYRSIRFAESTQKGEAILSYARALPGADAYRELARSLVTGWIRGDGSPPPRRE